MSERHEQAVVVYDSGCAFCTSWAERAQRHSGDRVRFLGSAEGLDGFPETGVNGVPQALVMRMPDGSVTTGAHAVLQLLSLQRRWMLPLRIYRSSSLVRRFTEFVYCWVARHRRRHTA